MIWQDWVIGACQLVFALALLPTLVRGPRPNCWTCVITATGMLVMAGTVLTMHLWWSFWTMFIVGIEWVIITLQNDCAP